MPVPARPPAGEPCVCLTRRRRAARPPRRRRARRRPSPVQGAPTEAAPPPANGVTITLDGRQVVAKKGELLISVAERVGTYIPRFCYHPRMKPVGMCRMCLVDVKGPRGFSLSPACYLNVVEGMEAVTDSPAVKKAQDGILEFLLVNHPLDCPVCDKGGECPLQDQTLAYGPGETRFVEEKRHWDKPIPLSALVLLDRERCIQCARCTRFADEVAGDAGIDFASRSDTTEVAIYPSEPFVSNFSGNVVQICPVGALLAKPYRFKARPWDLEQVETTCNFCAVGCRIVAQSSSDQVVRFLGRGQRPGQLGLALRQGPFSVRGSQQPRAAGTALGPRLCRTQADQRRAAPVRREQWPVRAVGPRRSRRSSSHLDGVDGRRIGVIGGARLPNEDAYAWAKLARTVLHTDNVDAQLGDGLPGEPRGQLCRGDDRPGVRRPAGRNDWPRHQRGVAGPLPSAPARRPRKWHPHHRTEPRPDRGLSFCHTIPPVPPGRAGRPRGARCRVASG